MDRISEKTVVGFLNDYRANSVTQLLEEGEANGLAEEAKKNGIKFKENVDLAFFKTIYAITDIANKNGARLPHEVVKKALSTLSHKPVDIDHIRSLVIGHYLKGYLDGNKIISLGVFYKSNFEERWEEAKKLFKQGKLTTSFEIHCPKDMREQHSDGTFSLNSIDFAGGGLLFRTKPAYKDAVVLEIAKRNIFPDPEPDLVYSSEEIITSDVDFEDLDEEIIENMLEGAIPKEVRDCVKKKTKAGMSAVQAVKSCWKEYKKAHKAETVVEEPKKQEVVIKPIKYERLSVVCPSCKGNQWNILESKEDTVKARCGSCQKEWEIEFEEKRDFIKELPFDQENRMARTLLVINHANTLICPQCNKTKRQIIIDFKKPVVYAKCGKCGLDYQIALREIRGVKQIKEVKKVEGGNIMGKEGKKVEDPKPKPDPEPEVKDPKVEDPKPEPKKVEDPKPKVEPAPEPKVEDPKPEPKPEEPTPKTLKEVVDERTKEVAKLQTQNKALEKALADKKVDVEKIKADALKVAKRKVELGEYAKDVSDKDLLDDDKYSALKLQKENDELKDKVSALSKKVVAAGLEEENPSGHVDGGSLTLKEIVEKTAEEA